MLTGSLRTPSDEIYMENRFQGSRADAERAVKNYWNNPEDRCSDEDKGGYSSDEKRLNLGIIWR